MMPSAEYKAPTEGVLSVLPTSWVPYGELARLDKPTGVWLFYFPFLLGVLHTACVIHPIPSPYFLAKISLLLLTSTFFTRGAACAWNDVLDADLDRQVTRCRLRPVARSAVSSSNALLFTAVYLTPWVFITAALPTGAQYHSILYIVMNATYPLAKRVTHYAPVILGLTIGWPVFISRAALDENMTSLDIRRLIISCPDTCALYIACALWSTIYDTIYQFQDLQDDANAGIGSMAVRLNRNAKPVLFIVAAVICGCLELTGFFMDASVVIKVGACGGVGASLALMINRVDLSKSSDCLWWFKNGAWMVGGCLSVGFALEYALRLM